MKKILHLSDLHVGFGDCESKLNEIVKDILVRCKPASQYVVVITGDTVDDATVPNAYAATLAYLKLLQSAGYILLVVPGNHDYGSGGFGHEKYVSLFKEAYFGDTTISYPKLDIVDDIAFIGLDSMAATFNGLDILGADGELGSSQIEVLEQLLTGEKLKNLKKVVYLHHHPFDGKGRKHMLKDYKEFKRVIENRIDCLLFGHKHDGNQYPDVWGIPICFDGSSSTGKSAPKKPATPMRIIEV